VKTVTIPMLFGASLLLAGCNTVEGFGKDLSAAGNAITTTARKEEPKKDDKTAAPAPAPAPAKR